ncbi:MAG: hypothetical protein ABFQ64_06720 [Campylobacterota bacterium]
MENYHEIDKILFEKQHKSDRRIEAKLNELMEIVRNLEKEATQVNIDRFSAFDSNYDLPRELMESDDDNSGLLELNEHDYSFIKVTEKELLIMFYGWRSRGLEIIKTDT